MKKNEPSKKATRGIEGGSPAGAIPGKFFTEPLLLARGIAGPEPKLGESGAIRFCPESDSSLAVESPVESVGVSDFWLRTSRLYSRERAKTDFVPKKM